MGVLASTCAVISVAHGQTLIARPADAPAAAVVVSPAAPHADVNDNAVDGDGDKATRRPIPTVAAVRKRLGVLATVLLLLLLLPVPPCPPRREARAPGLSPMRYLDCAGLSSTADRQRTL